MADYRGYSRADGVDSSSLDRDRLLAGNTQLIIADKVTILSGNNVTRGHALGRLGSGGNSGKYAISTSSISDTAARTIVAVAAEGCNASSGDAECMVYHAGQFDQHRITFGTGHTIANQRLNMIGRGLRLVDGHTGEEL